MKKNPLRKILLVGTLFFCLQSSGQVFLSNHTIGPGLGCNAAIGNGVEIELPFPHGITFGQLNHLSTKFNSAVSDIEITFRVYVLGSRQITFYYYSQESDWLETGNLMTTTTPMNVLGDPITYAGYTDILAAYGNVLMDRIVLEFSSSQASSNSLRIDDTRVNDILVNYDDCDDDGLIDYYDCDPSNPQNQKILICHNGHTICVSPNASQAHLNHGDYLGPCNTSSFRSGEAPVEESAEAGGIFPFPASGQVSIWNDRGKSLGIVTVVNVNGQVVYNQKISNSQITIDIKSWPAGFYLVKSDQMSKPLKFIKQ